MKPFQTYQYLAGTEMTERDKQAVGSNFWNEGKWQNYIAPFLPEDCSEMTFVDIGCNAGLFLKLAEDRGFSRVVGVDFNEEAVKRGMEWRDKHNGKYKMICSRMENCIETLPFADYTVLANTHYYFTINDWLDYLDRLQFKTRYCIIVTAEKRVKQRCWASTEILDIEGYFSQWENAGFIDALPTEGDPSPRKLWGLCFKSHHFERVPVEKLKCVNTMQDGFFTEIEKGIPYQQTDYYRKMKEYRNSRWTEGHLNRWFEERVKVYQQIKQDGVIKPIIVNSEYLILDGNHKYEMVKDLGFKTTVVRKT